VTAIICINKWDINPSKAEEIKAFAQSNGMKVAGLVRYDKAVTAAQLAQTAIPEYCSDGVADDIKDIWHAVEDAI
jgi:MinD superfamily P-loop ATPase